VKVAPECVFRTVQNSWAPKEWSEGRVDAAVPQCAGVFGLMFDEASLFGHGTLSFLEGWILTKVSFLKGHMLRRT
jgi:hypothetical protein